MGHEEDAPEPAWLLEGGAMAIHVNTGPRIVAVLLVDDGRKGEGRREAFLVDGRNIM